MTAIKTVSSPRPLSTPVRLKASLAIVFAATALFWAVAEDRIGSVRNTVQTIGKDSVPSIVAAEEIRAAFARANLDALRAAAASRADVAKAWQRHDEDLAVAADRLVAAAQNMTHGDEERLPIIKMIDRATAYSQIVGVARAEGPGPGSRAVLRQATRLLREEILPAAEALDHASFEPLDREYARSREATNVGLAAAGLLLLAVLGGTQVYFASRFKRLVNVPLALATLVVGATLVYCAAGLEDADSQVKVAKADAFDSIHALWQARAIAFDAASDEALFVLGGSEADELAFDDRSLRLSRGSLDEVTLMGAVSGGYVELSGLIPDELKNVTFPGERAAALDLARNYRRYQDAHLEAAQLVRHGSAPLAVTRCVDAGGTVRNLFDQVDASLGETLALNQRGFDGAVSSAFSSVSDLPEVAAAASLLVVALAWLGVRARLKEYAS